MGWVPCFVGLCWTPSPARHCLQWATQPVGSPNSPGLRALCTSCACVVLVQDRKIDALVLDSYLADWLVAGDCDLKTPIDVFDQVGGRCLGRQGWDGRAGAEQGGGRGGASNHCVGCGRLAPPLMQAHSCESRGGWLLAQ